MARATSFSIDSLLSPLVQTCVVGLLLSAAYANYDSGSSVFWLATIGLMIISVGHFLFWANEYYRNRWFFYNSPKFVLHPKDVVLIVGGSQGLGLETLRQFLVNEPEIQLCLVDINELDVEAFARETYMNYICKPFVKETRNLQRSSETTECTVSDLKSRIHFFQCDVADQFKLLRIIKAIETSIGKITVLVNAVGIKHNEEFKDLSFSKIQSIFSINLFSYILTMKTLLKLRTGNNVLDSDTLSENRLFIVNIASVLGLISPANLSIYSATKAAIIAIHESIIHEYKNLCTQNRQYANINFLLVKLGQLDTLLFDDVQPPKPFLAPVLSHKKVATQIYTRIKHGAVGELTLPIYGHFIPLLKVLPLFLVEFLRSFSNVDQSVLNITQNTDTAEEFASENHSQIVEKALQDILGLDSYKLYAQTTAS